jgi:Ca2+-binding RTX toxin-like protein
LNGGIGDDYLEGSGSLDGGAGADRMEGRGGGNEFVVDNVGDLVVAGAEGSRGEHNQISAWISIDLRNTTHYQGVIRSVSLLEGGNLNITGNALENVLRGNSDNNILNGGAGRDTLEGRAGNDTYYVDNPGDRIVELKNGGSDTVLAIGSYVLTAPNVERLWAASQAGTAAMNLYGNSIPNHLLGNEGKNILDGGADGDLLSGRGGNDTLYGREGKDALSGGLGNDAFVFNTYRSPTTNVDRILDFTNAVGNNDYFALDDAFHGRLPLGTLAANRFHVGASAHDLDDRIIYNRSTGDLFFDADGNKAGGLAAVKFAHLDNHAALTNVDFVVF